MDVLLFFFFNRHVSGIKDGFVTVCFFSPGVFLNLNLCSVETRVQLLYIIIELFININRYEECKEKLVPFLKKVGFNPKKDIHFMPCSGLTGANLKEQSDFCPWYM